MDVKININLENLKYNYEKIREYTKLNGFCIPVVKANAYNFGSINVVNKLLNLDIPQRNYFVFCLDEGIELRNVFHNKLENIYVLSGNYEGEAKFFLDNNLTPVINNFQQLTDFYKEVKRQNKTLINIILQFNTGLNRNGFEMSEINKIKKYLQNQNQLKIEMILSHFGCGDSINNCLTLQQLKNLNLLIKEFPYIKKSFCATDATFNLKKYNYDCVRIGYGLYGAKINNYFNFKLKQVLTITALVKKDKNNFYTDFGLKNGLFRKFNRDSFILINNKKYKYKKILKNKLIIDSKDDINGKTALLVGKINNDEIFINDFANFFNSNIQEMFVRLLANRNNKRTKYKNCKSQLIIKNGDIKCYNSVITEIREIKADGWVGYDATKAVKNGDILATIFNGYADFLPRLLSNNYTVLINVKNKIVKLPIYGRISMDQFTVKIPKKYKKQIAIGNKVIVYSDKKFLKKCNKLEIEYMLKNIRRCDIKY